MAWTTTTSMGLGALICGVLLGTVVMAFVDRLRRLRQAEAQLREVEQRNTTLTEAILAMEEIPADPELSALVAQCVALRTPLTLVLGSTHELMGASHTLPVKLRGRVALAHRHTRHLVRMVDDILEHTEW